MPRRKQRVRPHPVTSCASQFSRQLLVEQLEDRRMLSASTGLASELGPDSTGLALEIAASSGHEAPPEQQTSDEVAAHSDGEPNNPPVAIIDAPPFVSLTTEEPIFFDGTHSFDPDPDETLSFVWTIDGVAQSSQDTLSLPAGALTPGLHNIELLVRDQHEAESLPALVELEIRSVSANIPPTADLTGPTSVAHGTIASFDASVSTDPDGEVDSYLWGGAAIGTDVSSSVALVDTSSLAPGNTYFVTLSVVDDQGATSTEVEHQFEVTLPAPIDNPPVAVISGPAAAFIDEAISFSGFGSFDPDSDPIINFHWDVNGLPYSSGPNLDFAAGELPVGLHEIRLVVESDHGGAVVPSTPASVFLDILPLVDNPPVAVIEGPLEAHSNETIIFEGISSFDLDGDPIVSYQWTVDGAPHSSSSTLQISPGELAVGEHLIGLVVVSDNGTSLITSPEAIVPFNILPPLNVAPVAVIDGPTSIEQGGVAIFDASASFDLDGRVDSYLWGGIATGTDSSSEAAIVDTTLLAPGIHDVTLTVVDGQGEPSQQTVHTLTVVAPNTAPVALIDPTSVTVPQGEMFTLDGSQSFDAEDLTVSSYHWSGSGIPQGTFGQEFKIDTNLLPLGDHTVTLFVSDSQGLRSDTVSSTVTVIAPNNPPLAVITPGALQTVLDGTSTAYFDAVSSLETDPGDSIVSYSWTVGTIHRTGEVFELSPAELQSLGEGTHIVQLTVTDTFGASDTDAVDLTLVVYDRGDAPASYGDAWQLVSPEFHLGAAIDPDILPQISADASGDDLLDGNDDEDGLLAIDQLLVGFADESGEPLAQVAQMLVEASAANGFLSAWIDFGQDGFFDLEDQIATSLPLDNGLNEVQFTVPSFAAEGETFLRLRYTELPFFTGPIASGTDGDFFGEVEDYRVTIERVVLPDSFGDDGAFEFSDIPVVEDVPIFIDPEIAVGYDYAVSGGPQVSEVLLPPEVGGDNLYTLHLSDGTGGFLSTAAATLTGGTWHALSSPVAEFLILGIDANLALDPNDPNAFVTGLLFDSAGTIDAVQTPLRAPQVNAIKVSSTNWSERFLDFVDEEEFASGLGVGFEIAADGGGELLPWTDLNQLHVVFNKDVNIAQGDLSLFGINTPDYASLLANADFSYDDATFTATWSFAGGAALTADSLQALVNTSTVTGKQLDLSIAPNEISFDVLPGDATRNGIVLGSDVGRVRLNQFAEISSTTGNTTPNYSVFLDINGSGNISGADVGLTRAEQFSALPSPPLPTPLLAATDVAAAPVEQAPPQATASGSESQPAALQSIELEGLLLPVGVPARAKTAGSTEEPQATNNEQVVARTATAESVFQSSDSSETLFASQTEGEDENPSAAESWEDLVDRFFAHQI